MRKTKGLWIIALLIGIAVGAGATAWWLKPAKVRNGVSVIEPGAVYRSGQLEPAELQRQIRDRGIKTVINLGSGKDWDKSVCDAAGATYIAIPVGDVWQLDGLPNPEHGGKTFPAPDLSAVRAALDGAKDRPVLFHCWGGTHRTGVLAAQYRIERQGWTAADAINEMRLYGFDIDDPKFANVLEYLRGLESERSPGTPAAMGGP